MTKSALYRFAMGLTSYQKLKILTLSILLIAIALFGAQTHAATVPKSDLIEKLQDWKDEVSMRETTNLREKDLQLELINRLMFQSQSKYREQQELQPFMQKILQDMQETDDLGFFLSAMSESLETLLEKNEDVISFMRAFTEFSSIQNPLSAAQFAEIRNYYDGRSTLQAKTMSLDEAADYVEQKEKEAAEFQSTWIDSGENLIEEYKDFTPKVQTDSTAL